MGASTDDGDFGIGKFDDFFHFDDSILRDFYLAASEGSLEVINHAVAGEGDFSAALMSFVEDELDAGDLARETTDDDSAV